MISGFCRFLKYTHLKQAFKSEEVKSFFFSFSFIFFINEVVVFYELLWKYHFTFVPPLQAKGQDIVQRSVLGPVLPEAMVCYLENYDAERISEIFLGEFDTPEAIWSSEMRYTRPVLLIVLRNGLKFKIKLIICSVLGGLWLKR